MNRWRYVFAGVYVLLISAGLICSCGGGGGDGDVAEATVFGIILDSNSDPVSGALVTITSDPVTTITNIDGEFSAEVEVGEHTITVTVGNSTVYADSLSVPDESPVDLGDLTPDPATPFFQMTEASVAGTYFMGIIDVDPDDLDPDGASVAVVAEMDGDGSLLYEVLSNSSGDTESGSGTFSVAADGGLSVDGAPGESPYRGQVSPDGSIFCYVDTDITGDEIALAFGVIQSSGMDESAFAGTYIMAQLGVGDGSEVWSLGVRIEADGEGNLFYQSMSNPMDSGFGTYSVDGEDGSITIVGETDAYAQLSPDGNVLLFVDTSVDAHVAVGVRQPSGMSQSDLTGIYHFVAFAFNDEDISTSAAARGDLISDGAGNVGISFLEVSDGDPETASDTVTMEDDGTMTTSGGMIGQISWDGGIFGFPDVSEDTDDSLFFVGIRKP